MSTSYDWQQMTVEEIYSLISSGGTPSRKRPEYYKSDRHLWVKSQELQDGLVYDTEEKITDTGLAKSSANYIPLLQCSLQCMERL